MAHLVVLALALALPLARGWSFELSADPTECDPLSISFSGGVPPYQFTFLRLASLNATLPFGDWGNGTAISVNTTNSPLPFTLPWEAGDNVMIVGSDASGFGTGGTSAPLQILPTPSGDPNSCTPDSANSDFLKEVVQFSGSVSQCGLMTAVFTNVTNPVSVAVAVAGGVAGESFRGDTSSLGNSTQPEGEGILLAWYMTVSAGDQITFYASDANGPIFVSPLMTVAAGSTGCLDITVSSSDAFPTATESTAQGAATSETTAAAVPTSGSSGDTSSGSASSSSSGPNIGAIVGGVLGGIAGIIAIVALVMLGMHKYNRHQRLLRRQTYGIAAYSRGQPSPPTPRSLEGEVRLKEMGTEGKQSGV